jgi:hypothetical protein
MDQRHGTGIVRRENPAAVAMPGRDEHPGAKETAGAVKVNLADRAGRVVDEGAVVDFEASPGFLGARPGRDYQKCRDYKVVQPNESWHDAPMISRFTDANNGQGSNRNLTRRQFLRFLGSLGAGAAGTVMGVGRGDDALAMAWLAGGKKGAFDPLPAMADDSLITVPGINTDILVRYGDVINEAGERFGFNNDFIAFFPLIRG